MCVWGGRPNRMGLVFIWPTYRDRLSFSSPDRSASNPAKGGRERGRNGWSLFGLRRRRTPPTLPARDGRGRVRTSARCTQYTMYLGADAHRSITVAFCCFTFFFGRIIRPAWVAPPPLLLLGYSAISCRCVGRLEKRQFLFVVISWESSAQSETKDSRARS